MICPFTRDWTLTVSIGCTVPSARMMIGTSFTVTAAAVNGNRRLRPLRRDFWSFMPRLKEYGGRD